VSRVSKFALRSKLNVLYFAYLIMLIKIVEVPSIQYNTPRRSAPPLSRGDFIHPTRSNTLPHVHPSIHQSINPPIHHSTNPSFHQSIIPSFHHSIIPLFHHSIIPSFHHSIIPSFHYSIDILPAFSAYS